MTDPADTSPPEATAPQTPRPDPQAFQLRGDPPRVMRLSRKALAVMGVVAGLGIGGSLIYALKPPGEKEAKELYSTDSRATAETINSGPKDYGQVPKLGAPLPGDLGGPIVSAQQRGQDVPVPPVGAQPDPRAQAAEAARQRVAQERDAARTSGVFLGGSSAGAAAMPSVPNLATAAPDAAAPQPPAQPNDAAAQSDQAGKRAFMAQASNARTVSVERLTAPASPNIVQAGSVVPAALITGIRSDLPGQITAQVTANVYDSITGRILLIPQGARLIGEYDSEIAAGQTRVLLAWDRLIMPDGRSIVLDRQPGADAAGYAGLQDRVNRKRRRKAALTRPFRLSGVSVAPIFSRALPALPLSGGYRAGRWDHGRRRGSPAPLHDIHAGGRRALRAFRRNPMGRHSPPAAAYLLHRG